MYYTYTKNPIGCFTEKEYGQYFEYSDNTFENGGTEYDEGMCHPWNYPHMVWVARHNMEGGWRHAIVKKTVAHVVVDEDDYGQPVVEIWMLKKNNVYIA